MGGFKNLATTLQEIRDDITGRLIADGLWGIYGSRVLLGYGQRYGITT